MFERILNPLLTLAYPQACRICQNSVESANYGSACHECWKKTRVFSGKETICHKCGRFLSTSENGFQIFCHFCDEQFYDRARAVGLYENALQVSVLQLKKEPYVPKYLQELFLEAFEKSEFQDSTKIIPIPLSKKRLIERGFNQAAVLAKILAGAVNIEIDENSLVRKIHTPVHRAGMDTKARESSVKNAFEVKRPKLIKGKILLVDDVFTSGATASACAKALKKAGRKAFLS